MQSVVGYPLGYQHLAPTSATGLTLPTAYPTGIGDPSGPFRGVKGVLLTFSTATVYWRDDGTAPTTDGSHGVPQPAASQLWYDGNFGKIQFISATGTVDAVFYG